MEWELEGELVEWRGPAPFFFVDIDRESSAEIKQAAAGLEYWGQIAVQARIGDTRFTTALFPKDGRYLLPVKVAVRRSERIAEGDLVAAHIELRLDR